MMINTRRATLLGIRIASDVVMVSIAWVLAYLIRFHAGFAVPRGIPEPWLYIKMLPFIAAIWFLVMAMAGFYRRTGQHRSPFIEGLDILQSCALATLAFIAFTFFYEEYRYSRGTLLIFAALHPVMIISGRSLIRKALRFYRRQQPARKLLIIGGGKLVEQAYHLSREWNGLATSCVGVILQGNDEQRALGKEFCSKHNLTTIDEPADWRQFLVQHTVHCVVIAIPYHAYQFLEEKLDVIADQVMDIKLLPDLLRYTKFSAGLDVVRGVPVISMHESPLEGGGAIIKRIMDVLLAALGLATLAPFFALIAMAVKLSSPGPVFYRQERMGLDGQTFEMLKFRSMPLDAEKNTGAVWANKTDGRATTVGRMLRRSSLDELPQLFNILKGEMSLVGPRPERPIFVEKFRQSVPGYMLRHKAKAGLTGWAQVNGWRGNTSLEKRIECDLYYIQNWSLWLDLRIIFMTFIKGFFSKNAY